MIKVIQNSKYLILFCLLMTPSLIFAQGSRYTGTYKKSAPIEYVNKSNIIIEGLEFSNLKGFAITLWGGSNIIIKNCKFTNIDIKTAIYAEKGTNILVTDCSFENVHQAFIAASCTGNVRFEHNDVKNVLGSLRGGSASSQAVQFRHCSGAGNSITYNAIENIEGESSPDDNINIFYSHGTPQSPIRVANNWIRGGGPSPSGGGILLGDWGGSYQVAENNIVVNPGQYGMGIAGGNNMTLRNNKIYSKRRAFTNVGFSICNWTADKTTGPSYNITVENNEIDWTHRDGYTHLWFVWDNMKDILKGRDTNIHNTNLDESLLPDVIINRARNTESDNPEENQPPAPAPAPDSPIMQVYSNRFDRIAIKYLVPSSSTPTAYAEGYSAKGELLITMKLPRYNQSFPISVPKGDYYIKITYPELGKTETTKITIK